MSYPYWLRILIPASMFATVLILYGFAVIRELFGWWDREVREHPFIYGER